MFYRNALLGTAIGLAAGLSALAEAPAVEPVRVTFGHRLSDFNGPLPFGEVPVAVDPATHEALVGWGREVRVFNEVGMQVHKFATSLDNAGILDVEVTASGDLFTAAVALDSPGDHPRVVYTRHDFRGVPLATVEPAGIPDPYAAIVPNRFFHRDGRLILVDTAHWLAVFVEMDGSFAGGLDLGAAVGIGDEERDSMPMTGVAIDSEGNFLMTCAPIFRAFAISEAGAVLASWGQAGSVAGTFGVVAGIARDHRGRTFIADKARGVVMVFDPAYRFLTEFGNDPASAGRLGLPEDVVTDDAGHVFVTQVGRSGISVYDVRPE